MIPFLIAGDDAPRRRSPLLVATLEGDVVPLGRSFLRRQVSRAAHVASAVAAPVSVAARVTRRGASTSGRVVGRGVSSTGSGLAVAGRVARRGAGTAGRVTVRGAKTVGHGVATAGRFIGHGVAEAARASSRAAQSLIRGVLKPLISKALGEDDMLLGADDMASKIKAIRPGLIAAGTTAATAAVAASVVAAPAAPAVPFLLPPILDELLDQVAKKGKSILGIKDDAPAAGPLSASGSSARKIPTWAIVAAVGAAGYLIIKRKRS